MARYWTSDLHLGHANIIGYSGRPFGGVDDMNEALIDAWNETVGPDDEVWVLGDVALGRIADTLPLTQRLQGRKVLVPGNHDRCWAGHSKGVEKWKAGYLDAGFDEVVAAPATVEVAGRPVLVDHFPFRGDSQKDGDRYLEHRPVDRGSWLLHGHVHERWRQSSRQINVGVDAWAGQPVRDEELTMLIDAGQRDLAPLPWGPGQPLRLTPSSTQSGVDGQAHRHRVTHVDPLSSAPSSSGGDEVKRRWPPPEPDLAAELQIHEASIGASGNAPTLIQPWSASRDREGRLVEGMLRLQSVTDWRAWHAHYDDPDTSLARRLGVVRQRVHETLAARAPQAQWRALSLCAGDGRDLLPELATSGHGASGAVLVERDGTLARDAAATAHHFGLDNVTVIEGDAGMTATFAAQLPVDLLLLCGIFGNISEEDIAATPAEAPEPASTLPARLFSFNR